MLSNLKSMHRQEIIPRNRSKDIACYAYFQGGISRGLWRFIHYRFTNASGWLLALTLLFMAYASNTLDLQAYTPLGYLIATWLVALFAALLSRPRVRISARHSDRIRVGDTLPIALEVTQQRRWRHELNVVAHRLPPALDASPPDGVRIPALAIGETARVSMGLVCRERGNYVWHGFRVETDFPFGLFRAYSTVAAAHSVLVTPTFVPLTGLVVPSGRRYQPGGVAMASHVGDSFEFIGNREYREGDNLRDMDWRATARLNRPIVREYREEYFLRVGVVLDTYQPTGSSQADRANFERAVSITAAIGDYMARSDYIVDLFAAGPKSTGSRQAEVSPISTRYWRYWPASKAIPTSPLRHSNRRSRRVSHRLPAWSACSSTGTSAAGISPSSCWRTARASRSWWCAMLPARSNPAKPALRQASPLSMHRLSQPA